MQISCDKCKHEYNLTKDSIKVTKFEDINVEYIECHKCQDKQIIACKDEYSRLEHKKFMKLNDNDRIKSLRRLKIHSDRLKQYVVSKSLQFMEVTQPNG